MQDSFSGVRGVAAGGDASGAIDNEGKLWMWGLITDATSDGTLPVPKTALGHVAAPCMSSYQKHPLIVPGLDPVSDVAIGSHHVLAVTSPS